MSHSHKQRMPRLVPLLIAVAMAIVLVNLLAWQVGDKLFLAEARHLDREKASRQVARIGKLLDRDARNLQRVILSRADRLARDATVRGLGLAAVDFTQSVSETFLAGTNIDAYLVEDAAKSILFARRRASSTDALEAMSPPEQTLLSGLPSPAAADNGGFYGLVVSPGGTVAVVAGVPVGSRPLYGWLIARRDLDARQVTNYGEVVESLFEIRPVVSAMAESGGSPNDMVIDDVSGQVRWRLNDLAGQPALQLAMVYNDEYEQHMAKVVALSRSGVLVLSLLAGILAVLLLWRRQKGLRREAELLRESERVARLAAVGELAAGVAHEVNNPNGMIRRNLDFVGDVLNDALPLLAERDDAGQLVLGGVDLAVVREQLPQLLDDMTRGSRRIGEIVRDLKDFARDDSPDDATIFDLNEAVAAAVRLLDSTIRKATDHFGLKQDARLRPVTGNLRQIEQVVLNLVQNACQALPDRERAITVTTRYDAVRRRNLVEVADEGCGIAPDDRERIFEPFFTTRRESGGTGLGLSVSLRIVKRHDGSLDFDSPPGRGTVATLSLPIAEERT